MTRIWLATSAAVLGLALSGCATKSFVTQRVSTSEQRTDAALAEVQTQVEATQAEISRLHEEDARLSAQIGELSETAKEALRRAQEASKLAQGKFLYEVTLTDEQVRFGFDRAELADEATTALDGFAQKIKSENRNVYIEVQGHTDSTGSEPYNLALGQRRAEQVTRYLVDSHGFPQHRLAMISYGESKPIADNSSKEGRSRNRRRVTLVVLE